MSNDMIHSNAVIYINELFVDETLILSKKSFLFEI